MRTITEDDHDEFLFGVSVDAGGGLHIESTLYKRFDEREIEHLLGIIEGHIYDENDDPEEDSCEVIDWPEVWAEFDRWKATESTHEA